jgi:hypothetical protein
MQSMAENYGYEVRAKMSRFILPKFRHENPIDHTTRKKQLG